MGIVKTVIVILLVISLAGCGAIFKGSSQSIDLQSSPSGATVTGDPGIGTFTTPTAVRLERKNSYEITFSKPGYESTTIGIRKSVSGGMVVLDVLFTGLIGVIVDAATGSWNDLKPETVTATLEKTDMGMIGPDEIEVTLSASSTDGDGVEIQSTEPVSIEIRRR